MADFAEIQKQILKKVDDRSEKLVFGYIRRNEQILLSGNMCSNGIFYLCLLYYVGNHLTMNIMAKV